MTRYTCGFFPRILAIIRATRYTCVFLSRILAFYIQLYDHFLTNAHICAHKKPIYMRYKQACGRCGRRKSSYKRHRVIPSANKPLHVRWSWKVTSVWINHGCNARVNFDQDFVLIHCSHSSDGCWLPDNGFVGIRGSVEQILRAIIPTSHTFQGHCTARLRGLDTAIGGSSKDVL